MNRPVWLYINTGVFQEGYLTEEEGNARIKREVEEESRYRYTHCYPSGKKMNMADFVCKYRCKIPDIVEKDAQRRAESQTKTVDEIYDELIQWECKKCPLWKAKQEINEEDRTN